MSYISELRKYVGHQPIINIGATIIVMNDKNEILLNLRRDKEGAGLQAERFELLDILSGKELFFRYPNGDEIYTVIALYKAVGVSGELRINDDESRCLKYFPVDALPELESRAEYVINRIKGKII